MFSRTRQDSAFAFDHYIPRVRFCFADKSDPSTTASDLLQYPLGTHARLAESTTGENEPDAPIADRSQLVRSRPECPVVQYFVSIMVA